MYDLLSSTSLFGANVAGRSGRDCGCSGDDRGRRFFDRSIQSARGATTESLRVNYRGVASGYAFDGFASFSLCGSGDLQETKTAAVGCVFSVVVLIVMVHFDLL
jgi:hypothetical protein